MNQYTLAASIQGDDNVTLVLPFHDALTLARQILMRLDDKDQDYPIEVMVGGTLHRDER